MCVYFRKDWESTIKNKVKIYSLDAKDKIVVNETFKNLHDQQRLSWTIKFTSFSFSCFVV